LKVSCDPILFFDKMVREKTMTMEEWFKIGAELGLDGTEIQSQCMVGYDQDYLQHLKEAIRSSGLQVSQFISSPDFSNPNESRRLDELVKVRQHVDAAAFLGAHCVRMTAGQQNEQITRSEGVRLVVQSFRRSIDYAVSRQVLLAYENHYKDYFWAKPDFSQDHDIYLEILGHFPGGDLKVNFDCGNPFMIGAEPVHLLSSVLDRVVHVHCSDRAKAYEYTHVPAGEGLADYPAIFKLLKNSGYDGWLSVEYNGNDGLNGLVRAIQYVRNTWAQVQV
jgi:sugar phosphate isomerase/epimerase